MKKLILLLTVGSALFTPVKAVFSLSKVQKKHLLILSQIAFGAALPLMFDLMRLKRNPALQMNEDA